MQENILVISDGNTLNAILHGKIEQPCIHKIHAEITNVNLTVRLDKYCLVVLNMPRAEERDFALLHLIREANAVPILVVSESASVPDKVSALRLGADGYLIAPFENIELIAQAHSLIRRYTMPTAYSEHTDLLQSNDLSISHSTRAVRLKDKQITLTPKEFDILWFFASHKGKVFSKEQIYTNVWGCEYAVDDGNITAHIRRVRKKIEPNPDTPIYIKTVWGVGYRFCES